MARRASREPVRQSRVFTSVTELDRYMEKLQRRIDELEKFKAAGHIDSDDLESVRIHMINTLREVYGQDSPEFARYQYWRIWGLPLRVKTGREDPRQEAIRNQEGYRLGIEETIKELRGVIRQLDEKKEDLAVLPGNLEEDQSNKAKSKKVFVVHGRDNEAKLAVARLIEHLGLEPIILHEQADGGDTLIEKLERNSSDIGFAIVLLTPDDEGHLKGLSDQKKNRARQNVILELGFFWGKLGRSNICCLFKDVELPSDFHGVVYVPFDSSDGWKFTLARNMKHAGYTDIDLNKIK